MVDAAASGVNGLVAGAIQTEVPSSVPSALAVSLTKVKFWSTSGKTLTTLSIKSISVANEGPWFCISILYTRRFWDKLKGS